MTEQTEIVPMREKPLAVMPVMDLEMALERRSQIVEFVKAIMVEGTDYGVIPGTEKDTLLKPGAEKLTTFFGLTPKFIDERIVEQDSDPHEIPYYFYRRKCQLWRGDVLIGEGSGSCNSRESKYRYREAKRECPNCGENNIRRSKEEYGGGWYCWTKIGGCGTNFEYDDERILSQKVGQIDNPDIADIANTILKMADKRALTAATLIACNASEFFTQDMEDLVPAGAVEIEAEEAGARIVNQWEQDVLEKLVELKVVQAKPHAVNRLNHSQFFNEVPVGELKAVDAIAWNLIWNEIKEKHPDTEVEERAELVNHQWRTDNDVYISRATDLIASLD